MRGYKCFVRHKNNTVHVFYGGQVARTRACHSSGAFRCTFILYSHIHIFQLAGNLNTLAFLCAVLIVLVAALILLSIVCFTRQRARYYTNEEKRNNGTFNPPPTPHPVSPTPISLVCAFLRRCVSKTSRITCHAQKQAARQRQPLCLCGVC